MPHRRSRPIIGLSLAAVVVTGLPSCGSSPVKHRAATTYDEAVLALHPYAFYHLSGSGREEPDLVGHAPGRWIRAQAVSRDTAALPNGTAVTPLRAGDYLQVPSRDGLSIPHHGSLSVIAWIRPDTLQFDATEGTGYVYILGKGESGAHEWAFRMYARDNREARPNRISVYVWNPSGGEGSGAYVQDAITSGRWMMLAAVIDTASSRQFPSGSVTIFKNGLERQRIGLEQFHVTPVPGRAPLRVGTRDLASYFQGAVGDLAIFDQALTPLEIWSLYRRMYHESKGRQALTPAGSTSTSFEKEW